MLVRAVADPSPTENQADKQKTGAEKGVSLFSLKTSEPDGGCAIVRYRDKCISTL